MDRSKPIKKADDDAKELIIELLAGKNTGGFDLDSITELLLFSDFWLRVVW